MQRSFLVKVRQMLIEWDFNGRNLFLDDASCALYCGDQLILSCDGITASDFQCTFGQDDDWQSFLQCEEFDSLVRSCKEKLGKGGSKGKAKGKHKSG